MSEPTKETLATLERVRALIRSAEFDLHPRLLEEDIAAWERTQGVSLPEEYRLFIREVGDGGGMPGGYCDFELARLRSIDCPGVVLPFPITESREHERLAGGRLGDLMWPELPEFWVEEGANGCLLFGTYPSGDNLYLVVTGSLRGKVWCQVDCGDHRDGSLLPFLGWLAHVLPMLMQEGPGSCSRA